MAGENRIQITISANAADAKSAVADLERQLSGLGGSAATTGRALGGLGGSLGSMKGLLASLGVAAVIVEIKNLGGATFETGRQLESLGLSLKAITGSSTGAQAELASITQLAKEYGQDFTSMTQSTKSFLAASKDTALAGSGARDVIRGVSAAVAALGLSSQDAQGVFLALGQMMSKGTVQAEELRGQLGERLPGAFGLAARAMGVSTAELGKMLEQGQVLATDMVPKLARALEQEYGQAAKEAGSTGAAAWNSMTSAVTDFYHALGDAGAYDFAKRALRELAALASQTAHSIRAATGTLVGEAKLAWLNERIAHLESPEALQSSGLTVDDSLLGGRETITAELKRLRTERSLLQTDRLEAQRTDSSRGWSAARERDQEKADALLKASQQATMESWSKSKDPEVAAWAKFELARAKSWKDVYSGKINHGAFEQEMVSHESALRDAQEKAAKRGASGAASAARADIRGQGVLQRVEDEIAALEESLGGDRLGAAIARIEREHNRALTQIRADLVGAKGGVEDLREAEARLGELKALKTKQAELRAFDEELGQAARQAQEMAQWTGGSDLGAKWIEAYRQYVKELQDAGIQTDAADEERIARADERFQAHVDFLLDEDVRRLGEGGKLSDAYWTTESKRLDAHLEQVRKYASSETAYNVYASQKRSELRRQELEARLDAQDSFLGYLGDYLSLEFGLYKDHVTRTREMWRELAASTANFVRSIGQDLQDGLSSYLDALLTNDAKKREEAWRGMLKNMLQDTIRWVADMAMTLARQTLFLPIMASIVGVDSSGLEGLGLSVAGGKGQGGGFGLGQVSKYAGYAKDGLGMLGGGEMGGWVGSLNTWGANNLGFGTEALPAIVHEGNVVLPATSGTGLGSALSAGGMGLAGGMLAGQLLRPDDSTSSIVGGALGALGGGAAALLKAGAWAGPIGIAVGAIAAGVTAAMTEPSKSYSWGVPKASQPAVWIVDGEAVPASYGVIKTTSSGFGGSQSTSHTTIYDLASSEITAQVTAGMAAATAGLKSFAHSLGQSDEEFRETMRGVQSLMIAIPEGYEQLVYSNLANLQGEEYLRRMGLIDQANGLLRSGESYIDLITRTETAATTAAAAFGVMGLQLEALSGSSERLIQGDWASQIIESVGGGDAFVAVLNRYNKYAYDAAEQAERQLAYYGAKASEALSDMGGVGLTDFWERYRERMEAGVLSADEFKSWAEAAVWVEQAYTAATAAADQQVAAERERLTAMEATRRELESQRDAWEQARESLRDFVAAMRTDQLSTLAPTAILAERRAAYEDVLGRARAGDLAAQAEYRDTAAAYREYAHGYYGANGEYAAIDAAIQADAAALISLADVHAQAADDQLEALLEQIEVSQAILESTTLVNENLARISSGQVAVAHMAAGGLVTGGIPNVDSVPAMLMPGERVFSAPHSRIIERLAANTGMDTATIERLLAQLLAAVATGNQSLTRLLERVDGNTASMASNLERA